MPVTPSFPAAQIKLQKTKRDIRWLHGVTGEWFEEIQRKKFCNETDVSQMLKQPLTCRLRKEMPKNDPLELQTSRSKTPMNQKPSVPSQMNIRSSFASLFSFRKSGRETSKLQSLRQKGCDGCGSPVSVRRTTVQEKTYTSSLESQPVDSAFVPRPGIMMEESGMPPPWDAPTLENELFQVLDDLDSKLAEEQSAISVNTRMPLHYGSRSQFGHSYSSGNRHGGITGGPKNRRNETSNMSIYDILRPGTPREGFKTFSPRTRTIYDMYRTREPRVFKEDYVQKNTFGSTSLCFDSRQRSSSPATGHFTARSLHFPASTQNKSSFVPPSHQQSPKRTPLSSIIWNRSDFLRDRQNQEDFQRAPSPMEMDPADQCVYPRCFQENGRYELYHSQKVYQNAPMDNKVSPDAFENSENMPFYQQDNPFARSFFSNTFRQRREQRFGQTSSWSQQEEHSSWSDFHQSRRPFTSSDRDFEMISIDANSVPAVHGHNVPFQHWEPFSSGYEANVFRSQEESPPWQPCFQMSPLERMEIPLVNKNQSTPNFGTPNVCSLTDSNCHIKSSGLENQQDSSLVDAHINKEPYSFGISQTRASSFKTSSPQIPDNKGKPQCPNFQGATVTLQKIIPTKLDSLPTRDHMEVTNRDSINPPPLVKTQPDILVTEMNNEKDENESILEDKQLNKTDQTNMIGEMPQSVSQTVSSSPLPDFQNALSQDPDKNNRFGFNVSTTISSKSSPRVFSRLFLSQRDKANELKKDNCFPGNRKCNSATSSPFIEESRTPPYFPSPNQDCHQELTVSNEDISSIVKNNQWCSEPTDNQNSQSLDTEGEQCPTTHSANCTKMAAGHNISCDSLGLSLGAPPDSSPWNNSFPDALVSPSSTVFSSRTPSDKNPSLGEREEKTASKNQNNQFAVSSENQKSHDSRLPMHNEVAKYHSESPVSNGKGRGRVRHRISCIEKLSKTESTSIPTSEASRLIKESQSNSKASELDTIYCTLPRKSSSFLINSRQPESKIRPASIRHGPLPFQIKNDVGNPIGKCTSNELSSSSPESVSECSKAVSDSALVTSEVTERMADVRGIRSASVRKGPLPFLIRRALSCPSEKTCASTGKDERTISLVSDTDASAITPGPRETTFNSLQSDPSVRGGSLSRRHHQKEFNENGSGIATQGAGTFTLSNEDRLPFCADVPGKEKKKTLHKFKTTSMFSVSGDEDNIKCLEVVSIYYTLPRKPSKRFCDLLQQYTQDTNLLTESLQAETEAVPISLERGKPNYSAEEQSGAPSSEELKRTINSDPCCPSHTTENTAVVQLSNRGPSEPSIGTDVSVHTGEPEAREIVQDNLAKTPQDDSQSGKKLQNETLHTSLMHQGKNAPEEKSEICQESNKTRNNDPSGLPAHSEGKVKNSQTRRGSEECAGSGIAIPPTGTRSCFQKDHTALTVDDSSSGSPPREVKGKIETDCQKVTDKMLSDPESQAFALTPALHKLQFVEETHSGELHAEKSEPRELPQGSQKVAAIEFRKVKDEIHKATWGQTLLSGGNNKNKTNLAALDKAENRSSIKHSLVAMFQASKKFSAKDLSPRRHVATIFPQNGSTSGFGPLCLGRLECNPSSPEPTPKSRQSIDERSLSNDGMNVEKSENPLLVPVISNREPSSHSCDDKSNNMPLLLQNEFKKISESPPKHENSKDVTIAQILEGEAGTPVQLTSTSLRESDFPCHQRRFSPPLLLEPTQKSMINCSLASYQQQQRSTLSPEWDPEPQLYRSKSLKNINVLSDQRTSHPPKVRGRHFSESTSIDDALSRLTLGNDFSDSSVYSRRFKSFSELPSGDENESWALYKSRTKTGAKTVSSVSRPIDYGIFGKEQQLAYLENVKRSLTQGRLWKPGFLKNPGFLKDNVNNPSNLSQTESLSSNSPEDGLFPSEPLNIYEKDPGDSDCDTDTTTDDEYYLDENDKESEL
ncbi:exophilin-5 isoform X2 [Castor canadensis]|uniref:Exophilin-5 isoform X2 n=1 Tax=Castor canadensis TaxID=51338 RepID=A0AC58M0E2_CASCN